MKVGDKIEIKSFAKQILGWGKSLPVKEVYPILGFSRLDNFIRFLKNPKYQSGLVWSYESDLPCKIYLHLFFDIVKLRLVWNDEWDDLFTKAWTAVYEKDMLRFTPYNQKSEYRFGGYSLKVGGKFYLYSINTMNIAKDNNLCPYDLYKFCAINFLRPRDNHRCSIDFDSNTPYLTFNGKEHVKRYQVMVLLQQIRKDYPMNELQKKRLKIYSKIMDKMLMTQFEVDSARMERENRNRLTIDQLLFGGAVTEAELTELKKLYRKAAFLCHPDVTGLDGSMFRTVTAAYNKKDLRKMHSLYKKLTTEN